MTPNRNRAHAKAKTTTLAMNTLKIPKESAMKAAIIGAKAPIMLPGRKYRAKPMPLCLLGLCLAVMAVLAAMP